MHRDDRRRHHPAHLLLHGEREAFLSLLTWPGLFNSFPLHALTGVFFFYGPNRTDVFLYPNRTDVTIHILTDVSFLNAL